MLLIRVCFSILEGANSRARKKAAILRSIVMVEENSAKEINVIPAVETKMHIIPDLR
ncbi:hypothetical protein GCM10010916_41990 [Paenibacillus abyssi]|uniref:Uncharacterized protein n=1 Tax=Paenibacillus abyssi TaxID=1340531 RepID=A0A917LGC1_9BACL|nr:hypothetical protein GCM10010916_41990 [Paenibacillus abyssi]